MTALRDARLQRALDHAPDAALQPSAAVRDAIHRAAHQAVRPPVVAPTAAWWTRLWKPSVQPGMPWNAAFASLLLASMVTLLWQGEEVPDAVPKATAPAALPAKKAEVTPPPPPPALSAPAPVAPTVSVPAAAPLEQKRIAPAPQQAPPPLAPPRSEALAERAASPADVPVAPPAPAAMARREAADSARAGLGAAAEREAASAAPPPVPAAVAAAPAGRSAATAKAQGALADKAEQRERAFAPLLPSTWTEARIVRGNRQRSVLRGDAGALADFLHRVAAGAPVSGSIAAPDATIVLLHNGQVLGQLELAGDVLLWSALQNGVQRTTAARPDPALRDALQAEITRLTGS